MAFQADDSGFWMFNVYIPTPTLIPPSKHFYYPPFAFEQAYTQQLYLLVKYRYLYKRIMIIDLHITSMFCCYCCRLFVSFVVSNPKSK